MTTPDEYKRAASRYAALGEFRKLEMEEQAHVRMLVRKGYLRFVRRSYTDPDGYGRDVTFLEVTP